MKKIALLFLSFLFFVSTLYGEEKEVDFEVKSGMEIIGGEERPKVFFFLPPPVITFEKRKVDLNYFLDNDLFKKDLKGFQKEDSKDVSDIR